MSTLAERLTLVLKAIALSRGQLAADLALDKSVVSRWLSGATVPTEHNLARLTARIAKDVPGFTMLDWDRDIQGLQARLRLGDQATLALPETRIVADLAQPLQDLPDFFRLPAFAVSVHETAAHAARYCGLWEAWMPTFGHPDQFHCEHTVIRREGNWLAGYAVGVCYRWPLTGFIANGQLLLVFSDAADFVIRQFSRADEPIIDAVDGLMLAAASLPHQAPTASRVIMHHLLDHAASEDQISATLSNRAEQRAFYRAAELPPGMVEALLPECGPTAATTGGERLLRADTTGGQVRTRWF